MYTVYYFIQKFKEIPENKWNDHIQFDAVSDTRCAFGHCATKVSHGCGNGFETIEGKHLSVLFEKAGFGMSTQRWITTINNGFSPYYKQPTPKQRILAALHDIKEIHKKDIDTGAKIKERIVYVAVPSTIKEQTEQLILS